MSSINIMNEFEIRNHLVLEHDFKEHLRAEESRATSYSSNYGSGYHGGCGNYPTNDRCDCCFFEWSKLTSVPRRFTTGKDFFTFLKSCGISYTEDQEKQFFTRYRFYATCPKNEAKLILTNDFVSLKRELSEYEYHSSHTTHPMT